ncbi:MAG: hypothetical protein KBT00_08480 [Bacteroidales bacterium]|nr:hypothetical protein [Candidatus Cacconaster merdequi]
MYLALILFALIATIVVITAIKAVRAALRAVRSPSERQSAEDGRTKEGTKRDSKNKDKGIEKDPVQKKEEKMESGIPVLSETQLNRYAAARNEGISEAFWENDTDVKIGEDAISEKCLRDAHLSSLEMADRSLAGPEFFGFNLLVQENQKMTLTYHGQAIATLTRIEKSVTLEKDGEKVSQTKVIYRTNTFPPHLNPGMVPGDLEKMLLAVDRIAECNGNPELVAGAMMGEFCDVQNVTRLRQSIDPKIQEKQTQANDTKKGLSEKPRDLSQNKIGRSL